MESQNYADAYTKALQLENISKNDKYLKGHSKWNNKDYTIIWYSGNITMLSYPEKYDIKYKEWKAEHLPFIPDKYKYEVFRKQMSIFNSIKTLYNENLSEIIYTGSPTRIYDLMVMEMLIGSKSKVEQKILCNNALTIDSLQTAFNSLQPISKYARIIQSEYAKAIFNYTFTINYTRLLTIKYGYQFNKEIDSKKHSPISVSMEIMYILSLLAKKEHDIEMAENNQVEIKALFEMEDFKYAAIYDNEYSAHKAYDFVKENLTEQKLIVTDIKRTTENEKPIPYYLSELQQDCLETLNLFPLDTITTVQKLYEYGLITYSEKEVVNSISEADIENILKKMLDNEENKYIKQILWFGTFSKENNDFIALSNSIMPTGNIPVVDLTNTEKNVYNLICDRFISLFLPEAQFTRLKIKFKTKNGIVFSIEKKLLINMGYKVIHEWNKLAKELNEPILEIKNNNTIKVDFVVEKKQIQRYKAHDIMKISGIHAETLEKMINLDYIIYNHRTNDITLTLKGLTAYNIIAKVTPQYTQYAEIEAYKQYLDNITAGKTSVQNYQDNFNEQLLSSVEKVKNINNYVEKDTFMYCPFCKSKMFEIPKGYKCNSSDDCNFYISKNINSAFITKSTLEKLLKNGTTEPLNFKKKNSTETYKATLALNKNSKKLDFNFMSKY